MLDSYRPSNTPLLSSQLTRSVCMWRQLWISLVVFMYLVTVVKNHHAGPDFYFISVKLHRIWAWDAITHTDFRHYLKKQLFQLNVELCCLCRQYNCNQFKKTVFIMQVSASVSALDFSTVYDLWQLKNLWYCSECWLFVNRGAWTLRSGKFGNRIF